MYDLISKSALRKELSKLPSRMGYVKKSEVMNSGVPGNERVCYSEKLKTVS